MKVSQIRSTFLEYFNEQNHAIVSSSSLVPDNDPTLLFTNAGMVQFKDVFLGADKRDYNRATTSQRCVRAGGKHNDLENVGYTARHHTFFEMLGNFSFGDYFKEEAIQFAWQLLTKKFGLAEEKLWVTVFEEDDEAEKIWTDVIGVPKERVIRIGAKDNFWQMGDTGPCGPCTEIFYDHGEDVAGGPPGSPDEDGDRYIEIWNLVFMQYDRSSDGTLTPLPKPCVDTGMGLERIAAVLQEVHSNYEIDLFVKLIDDAAKVLDCTDKSNKSLRVIADHIRSTSFLIIDGVLPSNEGRGYVLRRIIRRAIRHGYQVGCKVPFMHLLVETLVQEMGEAYPELAKQKGHIEQILQRENERFLETLELGLALLDSHIDSIDSAKSDKIINGDVIFKLYDTYGFPVDLTNDVARERGLSLDMPGFETQMEGQRAKARSASSFAGDKKINVGHLSATDFLGYGKSQASAEVVALYKGDTAVERISAGDDAIIVLNQTPFYGESGGQVADKGTLVNANASFQVSNVQKPNGQVFAHYGTLDKGSISIGDAVEASINTDSRELIAANHSATHLLHAALNDVLGDHVQQKGSLVEADRLRFDFSHFEPITDKEILAIEQYVNREVRANYEVTTTLMPIEEARATGAQALFGEKYDDVVRVVAMGPNSIELCGGTHVARTGNIGLFTLTSESGVASGVRRIEALTGQMAMDKFHQQKTLLDHVASTLKSSVANALDNAEKTMQKCRELEKQSAALQSKLASASIDDYLQQVEVINEVNVLTVKMAQVDNKVLRDLIEKLSTKLKPAIVFLASDNGENVPLLISVDASLTKTYQAGKLLQQVAPILGGKGGGKPTLAQGGGSNASEIDNAFAALKKLI